MNKTFQYLTYLARHKAFVFQAGLKLGAPLKRLLLHDVSKFLPDEFEAYLYHFYGPESPSNTAIATFNYAWLRHQHRNPHHWQYWVLQEDEGGERVMQMPYEVMLEMVADWAGAGRAINGTWDLATWWAQNQQHVKLHHLTFAQVDELIKNHFAKEE